MTEKAGNQRKVADMGRYVMVNNVHNIEVNAMPSGIQQVSKHTNLQDTNAAACVAPRLENPFRYREQLLCGS